MFVELVRRAFPDRPDWIIVEDNIPLKTRYEVIGYDSRFTLINLETGEVRAVGAYYLQGNGSVGWIPTICFEVVEYEQSSKPLTPLQES